MKVAIDDPDARELRPLWEEGTGVCTSWRVSVSQEVGQEGGA